MNNLIITLDWSIPHYDQNWVIMNMIHFRCGVTWTQDEWQSIEQLKQEVHEVFQKEMDYIGWLSPIVKQKQEKFQRILNEFKKETPEIYNKIISKFK